MKKKLIPLEKALNFQIFKLSLLLGRELTKALKEFNLTPERWQVLAALWNADMPLYQTQLGEITLKDKPSISRLVDSMIKTGWLIKKQSDEDSRAYFIKPSTKANTYKDKIVSSLYDHFEPYFEELGKDKTAELSTLIQFYIQIIKK